MAKNKKSDTSVSTHCDTPKSVKIKNGNRLGF